MPVLSVALLSSLGIPLQAVAATGAVLEEPTQPGAAAQAPGSAAPGIPPNLETSEDWNRRLRQLVHADPEASPTDSAKYRIGPDDPHVSVFVRDLQSHPVSVMGAVKMPGVFQLRGPRTLLEVLSLAGGLSDDAGDTAIIMRGAGASNESSQENRATSEDSPPFSLDLKDVSSSNSHLDPNARSPETAIHVNLKDLLDSADPRYNPLVSPGDVVKVTRAGVVYVLGEVRKPGGFALKASEKLSVLQAVALSEGLTHTAAKSGARVIRTDPETGERKEFGIDLNKIMKGKDPDIVLESKDIVFVPNSAAKTTFSRGAEAATQALTGLLIFHW